MKFKQTLVFVGAVALCAFCIAYVRTLYDEIEPIGQLSIIIGMCFICFGLVNGALDLIGRMNDNEAPRELDHRK